MGNVEQNILDIGCGDNPWEHATILANLDAFHASKTVKNDSRAFICCDAHYLPFKKDSVDFLHSSNLLEHLDFPQRALEEFKRVSKHGICVFPSPLWELLLNREITSHKFIVYKSGKMSPIRKFHPIKRLMSLIWRPDLKINLRKRFLNHIPIFRRNEIKW